MDEQTKLKLAGAYAKRICTALYGKKPELSDTRYKEMKDANANSVYDRDIAAYYNRINGWNDFEQAQILCQLIDETEKNISSNLPVSQSFRTMITDEFNKAYQEMGDVDCSKIHKHNVFAQGKVRGKFFALKSVLDYLRNVG